MKYLIICLSILALFAANTSEAAKKKKVVKPEVVKDDTIVVPVPHSQIEMPKRERKEPRHMEYELVLSFWNPSSFTRSSYLANASKFERSGVPQIALNLNWHLMEIREDINLNLTTGFAFTDLRRSGSLGLASSPVIYENLNLLSFRAAAAIAGPRFLSNSLQPTLGLGILPTWALAPKSQFEERVSELGIPYEAFASLKYFPGFLKDSLAKGSEGSIGLGVHYIGGTVNGSELNGLGLQAIVSLAN